MDYVAVTMVEVGGRKIGLAVTGFEDKPSADRYCRLADEREGITAFAGIALIDRENFEDEFLSSPILDE